MTKFFNKIPRLTATKLAMSTLMAVSALGAVQDAVAALKCEEIMERRSCAYNGTRTVTYAPGQTTAVQAPVLPGFDSACWTWDRRFQCVESEPVYTCQSGTDFDTVKEDCNLVQAVITDTISIRGLQYITDATYTYRCAFGEWTTDETLPQNKECVLLDPADYWYTDYVPAAPQGSNPSTAPSTATPGTSDLTEQVPMEENRKDPYVCYLPPVTECSDTCYETKENPATGQIEQMEVACKGASNQCTISASNCVGSITDENGMMAGQVNQGPDGRCIEEETQYACSNGEIPRCLTLDNCVLESTSPTGIQDNGVAYSEEQTYICSNTTKSCAELATVSNCVHVTAWGWDNLSIAKQVGEGLSEVNQAMAKIDGIEKGMNKEDLYIFSGVDLRCHYAVGNFLNTAIMIVMVVAAIVITGGTAAGATTSLWSAALQSGGMALAQANALGAALSIGMAFVQDAPDSKAFGGNCCKDLVVEGSDKWYKLGKCTADEVKLSIAKRKGLAHYLGEYCSKKGGFPIKQCVQKTRTYCVFEDMLALVVNEQGRAQLDAMASLDSLSTKTTADVPYQLYGPEPDFTVGKYAGVLNNGQWVRVANENRSQVWAWQYPGYCQTPAKQALAYDIFQKEVDAAGDMTGIQPEQLDKDKAMDVLMSISSLKPYQECPSTSGLITFLTCSKTDDSCDTSATGLPEGPSDAESNYFGDDITESDVNWRAAQVRSFYLPTDYGVTAQMPSNSAFAAVSTSINNYISAVGSCHVTGECLYNFAITDKTSNDGRGAVKRAKDYASFPLYTVTPNSAWPAVNYVSVDGTLDQAAYSADINRGRGDALAINKQRFIFHPIQQLAPRDGNIHSKILVEYANGVKDRVDVENDYSPLMVPVTLPVGTAGWYPYGDTSEKGKYFYMSGGCDPNSRWCNYTMEVDLDIQRHPWGNAQNPRCWGFSIEQIAALDFNKMDLSKWINSLDLDKYSTGLTTEAAEAMTARTIETAQSFYSSISENKIEQSKTPGKLALITNTDILPNLIDNPFEAYILTVGVPSNWPAYFNDQPNLNPVSKAVVNWGDGSGDQVLIMHPDGKAYLGQHDYGDVPVGRYMVKVTLETKDNGTQQMSTYVSITADQGQKTPDSDLTFDNIGVNGAHAGTVNNAELWNGLNQAPENLEQIAPGFADQFERQDQQGK